MLVALWISLADSVVIAGSNAIDNNSNRHSVTLLKCMVSLVEFWDEAYEVRYGFLTVHLYIRNINVAFTCNPHE